MIGLIDIDGKLPNLALMKLSSYYKSLGAKVEFVQHGTKKTDYEKIYASALFSRESTQRECRNLLEYYEDRVEIGGTGFGDITKRLPEEIENMKPDYDLYTAEMVEKNIRGIMTKERKRKKAQEIVNSGMGFTSRGCVRNCGFCLVPKKEGCFRQDSSIADLINPKSNILVMHDNNITADPYCIDKLQEIKERNLIVDINQGCDIRLMNDDIAKAMSEVRHLRSIHYAWDLMGFESQVMDGIKVMNQFVKPIYHMCFVLVGYDTTFEEDMYRVKKLEEMGIRPYVMRFNERTDDLRMNHFARWVNSFIYKTVTDFNKYEPWAKVKDSYEDIGQMSIVDFLGG